MYCVAVQGIHRLAWVVSYLACTVVLHGGAVGLSGAAAEVTFTSDIAPVLFARCGGCHRPQGAAPFTLLTYEAARQRARLIAQVTKARLMPPWKSAQGAGDFVGHVHLTDDEIARIGQWVDDGAPEGDPARLPPLPSWTDGWQLGTPSLTVEFPRPYVVPADGEDFSRTFVLRLPVSARTYVKGFEFRPGSGGVVHHANIRIDTTSRSRELDDTDTDLGYAGLLAQSAVYPDGHFLGWTPGQVAPLLPPGLAWRLDPGTDLVVEMHFVPNGRPQPVQPAIALYFTSEPPVRTPAMLRLGHQNIEIPAGERHYVSADSFVLPVDVELQALQPHAHYRAREVKGTARLPDGTSRSLIAITDWDYRWQHVYRYVTPVRLPRGTTLTLQYVFDNSAENPRNPQQPPQVVQWGQRSIDEMGDLWVQMLTDNARDLQTLNVALQAKHVAEELVGYEVMIRRDPGRVSLRNDAAVLYAGAGNANAAAQHLAVVVQLQPDSAAAHYNLATALSSAGRLEDAVEHYRAALRLRPDYASAHNNLGHALLAAGKTDEARHHYNEAVRIEPVNASAHYNLGTVARLEGDMAQAIARFSEAVRLEPDWTQAVVTLAWLLATTRSAELRDVGRAVQLSEHAAALTERQDAGVLSVLAAAQAAGGNFEGAVATSDEALALPGQADPMDPGIRERRALYLQKTPYVSP